MLATDTTRHSDAMSGVLPHQRIGIQAPYHDRVLAQQDLHDALQTLDRLVLSVVADRESVEDPKRAAISQVTDWLSFTSHGAALQNSYHNNYAVSNKKRAFQAAELVELIKLAAQQRREHTHAVLCAVMAEIMDYRSLISVQSMLHVHASDPRAFTAKALDDACILSSLSTATSVEILSNVKDLDKATQPRMAPVKPIYEHLIAAHAGERMCWQDCYASFRSICEQKASREHLQTCLPILLEALLTRTPETAAEIGFLVTLLRCYTTRCAGDETPAAEALFNAVTHIISTLQQRLAALARSSPSLAAADFFNLFAGTKEVCTRTKELANLCFPTPLAAEVTARVSGAWEQLVVNFAMSDKMATFLRHLSPAAAMRSPALLSFLSTISGLLPRDECARLGLPRVQPCHTPRDVPVHITIATTDGKVVPVKPAALRLLTRVRGMLRLFCKWRALAAADGACAGPSDACPADQLANACRCVPLPVSSFALRVLLEYADVLTQPVVMGGAAAKQQLRDLWVQEMAADAATLLEVRAAALLTGFAEALAALGTAWSGEQ